MKFIPINKTENRRGLKKSTGPTQPGQPAQSIAASPQPLASEASDLVVFLLTYNYINVHSHGAKFSPPLSMNSIDGLHSTSTRKLLPLNYAPIQGIKTPFRFLNLSNRPGAPNATRRHSSPDLPPQSIPLRSERVTLSLSSSSLTSVHKFFPEDLSTARALHDLL